MRYWSMAQNVTIVPLDLRFHHKKYIYYSHSLPHKICSWFCFDLFCGGNFSYCRLIWYIYLTIYFQCCFISDEAIVWFWLLFWKMAWYHTATSHYFSQVSPRSVMPYPITRPRWVNQCQYRFQMKAVLPLAKGFTIKSSLFRGMQLCDPCLIM